MEELSGCPRPLSSKLISKEDTRIKSAPCSIVLHEQHAAHILHVGSMHHSAFKLFDSLALSLSWILTIGYLAAFGSHGQPAEATAATTTRQLSLSRVPDNPSLQPSNQYCDCKESAPSAVVLCKAAQLCSHKHARRPSYQAASSDLFWSC